MVQYTLAQSPEVLIDVPGRDSNKAREKAMDQLMALMDDGKLPTELDDGFNPKEFIEVKDLKKEPSDEENAVVDAVQTLSNLAKLKVKVQGSRAEALKVRELIDLLFTDEVIEEEQIEELNSGFKTLKTFAQTNLKYRDAKDDAESAREILDNALNPPSKNTLIWSFTTTQPTMMTSLKDSKLLRMQRRVERCNQSLNRKKRQQLPSLAINSKSRALRYRRARLFDGITLRPRDEQCPDKNSP